MSRRLSFMDRASFPRPSMRASALLSGKREQLATQAEFDLLEFNASLGCPLASYEDATLSLVGGKALQCWRMMRFGLPVPAAFVIPTYVYSLHIDEAGVHDLIDEVFSSDLHDASIRDATEAKLEKIRDKIMSTPLNDEVVDNLKAFLSSIGNVTVAVRSSGSAEDLASQSFAGQYDTFLYKKTVDEIIESIKGCWKSMFQSHIMDYASKSVFPEDVKVGDKTNPKVYTPGLTKPPKMGVLVMQMVEAKSSGVCFSKNLWGEPDEIMIESVFGQGEGLVSGELTPDRYVVSKSTSKLCYQDLTPQTHKFVRSTNMDGVEKVAINRPSDEPVLNSRNLRVC
jgi:pyruvate,water dikinase